MPVSREYQANLVSSALALITGKRNATQRVACKTLFATHRVVSFILYFATQKNPMGGMAENEGRLSQRQSQDVLDDLKRVADESGISQVALVAASIRGLAKTWDEQKELTFPFRVVPESLFKRLMDQAPTSGKRGKREG